MNTNNDNSEIENNAFDTKIANLQECFEQYESLSDIEKLKNNGLYNKIIIAKNECMEEVINLKQCIDFYKINADNIDKIDKNKTITDDEATILINELDCYKKMTLNDMQLSELLQLYANISNIKEQLDAYFDKKHLEIINL